jgi:hypothetical protein
VPVAMVILSIACFPAARGTARRPPCRA